MFVVDSAWLLTFFFVFIRCGAMLMSSPLTGNVTPVNVRVQLSLVVALVLTPVARPYFGEMPSGFVELVLMAGREAVFGLLIGMCIQLLVGAVQAAGGIADLQLGVATAQIFNPMMGGSATPLAQFKFWLCLVTLLCLNAHQLMFQAFVRSFAMPGPFGADMGMVVGAGVGMFGQLMMVALQIAAPVVGVTVVVDVAAGLVNKAVPQTQPFLLALPAKLALGMVALSFGLPALVVAVERGLVVALDGMGRLLGGA